MILWRYVDDEREQFAFLQHSDGVSKTGSDGALGSPLFFWVVLFSFCCFSAGSGQNWDMIRKRALLSW